MISFIFSYNFFLFFLDLIFDSFFTCLEFWLEITALRIGRYKLSQDFEGFPSRFHIVLEKPDAILISNPLLVTHFFV